MSSNQTKLNYSRRVKPSQLLLGKVQKEFGRDSQIVRDLLDYYRVPLVRAITRLNKVHGDTFETIAEEVFKDQISRQAVQQNYTEGKI